MGLSEFAFKRDNFIRGLLCLYLDLLIVGIEEFLELIVPCLKVFPQFHDLLVSILRRLSDLLHKLITFLGGKGKLLFKTLYLPLHFSLFNIVLLLHIGYIVGIVLIALLVELSYLSD